MRRIHAKRLQAGMTLASPIRDERGRLILPEATTLDAATIDRIARLGVDSVYVHDPRFQDLEFHDPVDERLRRSANELFGAWQAELADGNPKPCVSGDVVGRLVSALEKDMTSRAMKPVVLLPVADEGERLAVQAINGVRLVFVLAPAVGMARYAADIAAGAFVRDIGLLALPPESRRAANPLQAVVPGAVRDHPTTSLACLRNAALWPPLSKVIVTQHHERLDGSGYPEGLKGEKVHPAAALVAVIDAYTALVNPWPDQPECTAEQALDFTLSYAGSALDVQSVRALCGSVGLYAPGTMVRLSTGQEAVVLEPGCGTRTRPRVRVLPEGESLDLQSPESLSVQVEAVIEI